MITDKASSRNQTEALDQVGIAKLIYSAMPIGMPRNVSVVGATDGRESLAAVCCPIEWDHLSTISRKPFLRAAALLQQAAPSKDGNEDARKALLTMEINSGKLVMSIGVEALATAIEGGPMFEEGTVVTDHDVFAKEMLAALQDEDEAGTNLIHRAFDAAFEVVAESGAEGVTFPPESF